MDTVTMSLAGASAIQPVQGVQNSATTTRTENGSTRDNRPEAARTDRVQPSQEAAPQRPIRLQPAALPSLDDKRDAFGLTAEERRIVEQMQARHDEVVRHEEAHRLVGGQYASAPRYDYEQGPDGRRYAVGGSVKIDTSPERDPEATIAKMDVVKRAALAPAEPSPQDRKVAQTADQIRQQALAELMELRAEERRARMEAINNGGEDPLAAYRQRAEATIVAAKGGLI